MKKKQSFPPFGISEKQADQQLAWTLGWSCLMLALFIVSIFRP